MRFEVEFRAASFPRKAAFRALPEGFGVMVCFCLSRVLGFWFRILGFGFGFQVLGFGVKGLGFRVKGLGFRVCGLGFRASTLHPTP